MCFIQCKQGVSKIQITSVKSVSALPLSYWQSSFLLLIFHCNTLLKQNDVFSVKQKKRNVWYKATFMLWQWTHTKGTQTKTKPQNQKTTKILENRKLPLIRDFECSCRGINKIPSLFFLTNLVKCSYHNKNRLTQDVPGIKFFITVILGQ